MGKIEELEHRIEAVLFASGEPIEGKRLAELFEVEEQNIAKLVQNIQTRYKEHNTPFSILTLADAYQMATLPAYAADIQKALSLRQAAVLSQAALEVLAIIAYNQPVTRAFVEEVRGVDCSTLVKGLVDKGLITEAGRMNVPGKPILYKTTPVFLRSFSLENLEQLPILPEPITKETEIEGQTDLFEE